MLTWLYCATGNIPYRLAAVAWGMKRSKICEICQLVPRILKENGFIEEFIRLPTIEEALRSARIFTERSGLPSIFWAAIDRTHVEFWVETKDKTSHWNRYSKLSLNVMIVANPEGMIHTLKADSPGSDNDMKVFKESKLYKTLVDENIRR